MSEKRMVYINILNNYYQLRETDDNSYCCRRLDPTEVSDLLNEQRDQIINMKKERKKFKEENEQLLKENVFLAKQRNYWKGKSDMAVETFEIDEANAKQIRKLEKENEQLKKRLSLYENEDEVDNYLRTHPMPTTTIITNKRKVIPLNMRHKW